ncbi:oxidoreductase [Micromonospora sp. ATCC 39149]|uniref:Aldo/keto reductase n=1 Tax=Micromonospora carbonacea TaxID=47853 RepID=A0A7D6CF62_9ACTN|nr:aldo/keto reductase [Micromonospora sp. ATCC 39149]EEP73310.1 oxidoreductase [Micromonospora sp. ATCC 39149]QLJ99328.1 aldo/keto reductase [Micromonospora carbonacea]
MRQRCIGERGPLVSALGLGTWALGGQWGRRIEPGVQAVRRAFDLGVTLFDTSRAYGGGAAEAALARGLADLLPAHRDEIVIATAGGLETRPGVRRHKLDPPGRTVRNSDPAFLRDELLASLRQLGTDHVDVYSVHWPDPTVPLAETAEVLAGFVREGLARHVGFANVTAGDLAELVPTGLLDVVQVPFNLLDRGAEKEVLPRCQEAGVGVLGGSALAHGLLTGALHRDQAFAPEDWRAYSHAFRGEDYAQLLDVVDGLAAFAAERGHTVAQVALAWALHHPAGVVPVFGAQSPGVVEENVRAAGLELSEIELRELELLVRTAPAVGSGAGPACRTEERDDVH